MTPDWGYLSHDLLQRVSSRIIDELRGRQAPGDDRMGMTAASAEPARSPRASWRGVALALAVPLVLAAIWCGLMSGEAAGVVAGVLGPWAGLPLGHRDCTMAHALPGWSTSGAAIGAALLLALPWLRRALPRSVLLPLLALWATGWSLMALMSVLNTQS